MANKSGGRLCPKCGTILGQKNICPVCAGQKEASSGGRNGTDGASPSVTSTERLQQYRQLKKSLADNPKDFAFVLGTVRTILKDYVDYFQLEIIDFLAEMYYAQCPFACFAVLMDPVWNPVCRGFLDCAWSSEKQTATLKRSPFFWSPFLLKDTYKLRRNKAEAMGDSAAIFRLDFFKCNLTPPFSLWFFGADYTDLKDGSLFQNNPAKPIKYISLDKRETDGWEEVVPEEKRVLVLYCGHGVELKCDPQADAGRIPASPAPRAVKAEPKKKEDQTEKKTSSIPNAFGLWPERWKDISVSGLAPKTSAAAAEAAHAADDNYRIFTACDGLQIRRNSKNQTRDTEYSLLYLVEP